jgi:TPR repeat protein
MAAAQGVCEAQHLVGMLHYRGLAAAGARPDADGEPPSSRRNRNEEAAVEWLAKAAAQGDVQAMYMCGFVHAQVSGCGRSRREG